MKQWINSRPQHLCQRTVGCYISHLWKSVVKDSHQLQSGRAAMSRQINHTIQKTYTVCIVEKRSTLQYAALSVKAMIEGIKGDLQTFFTSSVSNGILSELSVSVLSTCAVLTPRANVYEPVLRTHHTVRSGKHETVLGSCFHVGYISSSYNPDWRQSPAKYSKWT